MTQETLTEPLTISFSVFGRPQQRGSKTPWIPKRADGSPAMKNGRIVIATMDSNKHSNAWMSQVRSEAHAAYSGELLRGPVRLSCHFYFKRPKSHFGTGAKAGTVKASAPKYYTTTPDLDKLVRAIVVKQWTTAAENALIIVEEVS